MKWTPGSLAAAIAVALVFAGAAVPDADAATRRKVCRVACDDEIAACIDAGLGSARACRRQFIRECLHSGVEACADPAAIRTGSTWVLIAPDPVVAAATSPMAVRVEWTDTNTQESGYMVERSTEPDRAFVEIAVTGSDETSILDTGLAPDRVYYYRVRAYRTKRRRLLYSYYSAVAAVRTPPAGVTTTTTSTTSSTTTTLATTTTSSTTSTTTAPPPSSTSTTVPANQPPVANAGSDFAGSVGQPLTFDGRSSFDPDGTIVQWLWNFGDGGLWGTTPVAEHTYAAPGIYTVTLYVADNANAWASDSLVVTVGSPSTTTSTSSSTSTSTSSTTSSSTSTSTTTSSTSTSSTAPTSTSSTSSTTTTAPPTTSSSTTTSSTSTTSTSTSTSSSSSTSTSTSSTSSTSTSTVPNQAPVAKAGPDREVVAGMSVTFDGTASFDSDGQIVAWAWNFGDGGTAGTPVATHAYTTPGVYAAVLWVQDDRGAWSTDTATVTVTTGTAIDWLGIEAGGSSQQTKSVARTGAEDVVAGGFTNGSVTIGTTTLAGEAGRLDGYVAKYGATGTALWARQIAAASAADSMVIVESVAGDSAGGAVAAGRFTGTLVVAGTTLVSAGGQDAFVIRFGPDGSLVWARRFGGTLDDLANAAAVDADGSVVVTGSYTGQVDFGGGPLEEVKIRPAPTLFVLRLTAAGLHAWSKSFPGSANEVGRSIAIASSGDLVVGGVFDDRIDLGTGWIRTRGVADGFVVQLTSTGAHRWSRQLGGTAADEVAGVAVGADGTVAVTGRFRGDADFGGGTISSTPTVSDAFIASYTAAGAHRWSRAAGSTFAEDNGASVAIDDDGHVFVVGAFMDTADFGGPATVASFGGRDAFLLELTPNGAYAGVDTWGGTGNDEGLAVAAWGSGRVAATGFFRGNAVVAGTSVSSAGSSDGFTTCTSR